MLEGNNRKTREESFQIFKESEALVGSMEYNICHMTVQSSSFEVF